MCDFLLELRKLNVETAQARTKLNSILMNTTTERDHWKNAFLQQRGDIKRYVAFNQASLIPLSLLHAFPFFPLPRCIVKKPVEHFANINQPWENIYLFLGQKASNQTEGKMPSMFTKFYILIDVYHTIQFNLPSPYTMCRAEQRIQWKIPYFVSFDPGNLTIHDI